MTRTTPPAAIPARPCLACAELGTQVRVVGVDGGDDLAERLRASGLWEGALVELVGKAPFGDPMLFKLHGFRLALRRSEAERVAIAALLPVAPESAT